MSDSVTCEKRYLGQCIPPLLDEGHTPAPGLGIAGLHTSDRSSESAHASLSWTSGHTWAASLDVSVNENSRCRPHTCGHTHG